MNKIIDYIKTLSDNEKIGKFLVETIGKILLKQDNIELYIKENENKIIHIRDWISSVVENNEEWKTPRVLTIDALNNTADKYFEKKSNKIKTIKLDETHEKLIADLGDYYIIQMLTPQALDNETKQMQHCIGHGWYDKNLSKEEYKYLSLRDKFNKAHVTVELKGFGVYQLQGKQNEVPETKYFNLLYKWLKINNYNLDYHKLGFIYNKNDGNIYSKKELPDNCEIDGDLDFYLIKLKKLPNNLKINGSLSLFNSEIKDLPNNLVVKRNLNLGNSKIEELPANIKIGGNLNLSGSEIKRLPDNLIVNGDFNLSLCSKLEKLPDNLVVNGNLFLNGSPNLKELPTGLQVKRNLDLRYTNIKEISSNIKFGESLYLQNSKIERLPDDLVVNGDLDLRDTPLNTLPNNLKVKRSLNLGGTNIEKIQQKIIVNDLIIRNTKIDEISEEIKILNGFNMSFSKLKKIPENFKCENLHIDFYQIDLIKETMNFGLIGVVNNKSSNFYSKKEFFEKVVRKSRIQRL